MFPAGSIVIPDGLLPVVPSIADDAVRVRFVNLSPEIHPVHEVISSLDPGVLVQIQIFPELMSRNRSILFVRNTRSVASVVPMKSVRGLVPALPVRAQPVPAHPAGCHVATPPDIVST